MSDYQGRGVLNRQIMDSEVTANIMESEATVSGDNGDITENETSVNRSHYSCDNLSRKSDNQRNLAAFWILGLCNNFAYVVMLSAAKDILDRTNNNGTHNSTGPMDLDDGDVYGGHRLPKCNHIGTGAILLADILPTLLVKLTGSLYIQFLPYSTRVLLVVIFAAISLPVVSLSTVIWLSLLGVVFASLSGGLGELAFLGLMSHFHKDCVSTWSSGTGAAGLFGSLSYAGMTTAGLTPRISLLIILVVPAAMAVTYFLLLVRPKEVTTKTKRTLTDEHDELISHDDCPKMKQMSLKEKIIVIKSLLPYMIPLGLVYFAEYTINQALFELIYFPSTWLSLPQQYRWYQVLYQVGVFASRSSVNLFQIKKLWLLPLLQFVNLGLILLHVIFPFIPSVWVMFVLILYEGVLGGTAYVNTFYNIRNQEREDRKEFSMGAVSIADAAGIAIAGAVTVPLHKFLCSL